MSGSHPDIGSNKGEAMGPHLSLGPIWQVRVWTGWPQTSFRFNVRLRPLRGNPGLVPIMHEVFVFADRYCERGGKMTLIKAESCLIILNKSQDFCDCFLTFKVVIRTQGPASQGACEFDNKKIVKHCVNVKCHVMGKSNLGEGRKTQPARDENPNCPS